MLPRMRGLCSQGLMKLTFLCLYGPAGCAIRECVVAGQAAGVQCCYGEHARALPA
ncbi:hypothetical protein PF008_g4205 [Phytophthora fragariae]|uniref:Uncharacterized protein n=1 Tax=Phytophthora fragariae TaxID=53985 RepID=A0A6G0SBX9_9STRA|nr:hypothetical protein PF008_g4205 [Phytophthora fragariae]